ncbi:MAG TPA: radical SAM protein, partial [Elusimicrobiota bacterium]|nr:radical SAM protein [Elusimicrobiota bacterium]
ADKSYDRFSARVFERTLGFKPAPAKAQWEITYRCNLHCVHCYTDPYNQTDRIRQELPFDKLIALMGEMAEAGVLWVTLTGGEAVAHPRFRDIYRAAKERGFIVTLLSNATLLSDDLVEFLAADPPFQLDVSVHGATKPVFDRVAGVAGAHDRFSAGLRRALDRGLPVRLKSNAMTINRGELNALQTFVEGLGLDFNLYTTLYPRLDGDLSGTAYRLSPEEIVDLELGEAISRDCAIAPDSATESHPLPPENLFRCGCGGNSFTIDPYGMLRPCTFTTSPAFDLKRLPLVEAFDRMVETVRAARYESDSACRTCAAYRDCDKNPAMAAHEAGSQEAPVPHFCAVAFGRMARGETRAV